MNNFGCRKNRIGELVKCKSNCINTPTEKRLRKP